MRVWDRVSEIKIVKWHVVLYKKLFKIIKITTILEISFTQDIKKHATRFWFNYSCLKANEIIDEICTIDPFEMKSENFGKQNLAMLL